MVVKYHLLIEARATGDGMRTHGETRSSTWGKKRMRNLSRAVLAAVLLVMAVAGGALVAGPAQALPLLPVATGSLTFSGTAKDWVTQGASYSFATSNGVTFTAGGDTSVINIAADAGSGNRWFLEFDPPTGNALAPGIYSAAKRPIERGTSPGFELFGASRSCSQISATFTITAAVFGSSGWVQAFDATFEQQCMDVKPATSLHGQVHISNPPLPSPKQTAMPTTTVLKQPNIGGSNPAPRLTATTGRQPDSAVVPAPVPTHGHSLPSGDRTLSSGDSAGAPLVWLWLGVWAWAVVAIIGLAVTGVVLAVRRH
jgi:hypothetical protein